MLNSIECNSIKENSSDGYTLEVDLEYPDKLHELQLVPNLGNESKYVLHYRNLPLYLSLRIKLVNVHRILKFKQSN